MLHRQRKITEASTFIEQTNRYRSITPCLANHQSSISGTFRLEQNESSGLCLDGGLDYHFKRRAPDIKMLAQVMTSSIN